MANTHLDPSDDYLRDNPSEQGFKKILVVHKQFATTEERNAYISEHYPKRSCSDVPGDYFLPGGHVLQVLLEEIWEYMYG